MAGGSRPPWAARAGAARVMLPPATAAIRFARRRFHPDMLWMKSLHIVFIVTWFRGLFYLPRLFVYRARRPAFHRGTSSSWGATLLGHHEPGTQLLDHRFGVWLWLGSFRGASSWLHAKDALVPLLWATTCGTGASAARTSPPCEPQSASGTFGSTKPRCSCSSPRCCSLSSSPSSAFFASAARARGAAFAGVKFFTRLRICRSRAWGRLLRRNLGDVLSGEPLVAYRLADPVEGGQDLRTGTRMMSTRRCERWRGRAIFRRAEEHLRVNVTAQKSPLRSLEFARLKVKDAVCDLFRDSRRQRPDVNRASPTYGFMSSWRSDKGPLPGHIRRGAFKRGWRMDIAARRCGRASRRESSCVGLEVRRSHCSIQCVAVARCSRKQPRWRAAARLEQTRF